MSISIKDDKIVQKSITPRKIKTIKQRNKERKIVMQWALNNISQGESNYYYKSIDIYDKFTKDTKLNITLTSFGAYLKHILKQFSLDYINIKKEAGKDQRYSHRRNNGSGQCNCYFGIKVKDLTYNKQYFDVVGFKPYYSKKGLIYKKAYLKFNYFSHERFTKWFSDRLIVDKNFKETQSSCISLFNSYCQYYKFNLEPTCGNLALFGSVLSLYLKQEYPFVQRKVIRARKNNKPTANNCWTNIKFQD